MAAWTRLKQLLVENKKKIGAIAMAGLVVGTGAFALLSTYGSATAKMTVQQAIELQENGQEITIKHIGDDSTTLYGGETGYFTITILNHNREHDISVNVVGQITSGDMEGVDKVCLDANDNNACDDGEEFTYNSGTGEFSGKSVTVPKSDGTNPGSVTPKILVVLKDNAEEGEYQATIQVTPASGSQ